MKIVSWSNQYSRLRYSLWSLIGIFALAALSGCFGDGSVEVKYRGSAMGTSWIVKVNSSEGYSAELAEQIQEELDLVDSLMSNWIETSDVQRFNDAEPDSCVAVSSPTQLVMLFSQRVHSLSSGAFDITISPLIELWGFGTEFVEAELPLEEDIEAQRQNVGMSHIRVNAKELCKSDVPVQVNLSAVAKGYAVDRVAELLDTKELTNYLIEVGGELRARGENGRGSYWVVGIEQPSDNLGLSTVQTALPLIDSAVATSGDYRIFFEADEVRYSHIIDPTTGYPVTHNAASVTVIADSSMAADAWATALLVLGPESGIELANEKGLKALMILRAEEGFSVRTSESWPGS